MIVARIQTQLQQYKQWLLAQKAHPFAYWWESQLAFQTHWDIQASEPAAMFDRCLHNTVSRRLWQDDKWQPKALMIRFWQEDPMMLRAMFDDLYNETRAVEARISRFQFGMDTLLGDYKRNHPGTIENNHYHDDYRMIALYLAFQYPDQYAAPYDFPVFYNALEKLGARELPAANDLARFLKVHRTLMTFIEKEPEIAPALQQLLDPKKHYTGKSMLLAADFTRFVGGVV